MADLIDIELGDQRIRVPAWATEATLEAVMKYNEITARALNKLVGVGTDGKKTFRVQEHYFKQIVEELQKTKKKQEELVNQNTKIIKAETKKSATARAKDTSGDKNSTDFNKKLSELSKSYSTSISLVEGSLLYLSKSLIDLNLVLRDVSQTYKDMLRNSKRISKVFETSSDNGISGKTRSRISTTQDSIFNRERRDLSFKSLFTSFVEDLVEKQQKNIPLQFNDEDYMKGVNDLKKAIKSGNTKGLMDQYLKVLTDAVTQVSEGKTPTDAVIKELENSLKDFSVFNKEVIGVLDRLKSYYGLTKDKNLSPNELANKEAYETFKNIVNAQEKLSNATIDSLKSLTSNVMTTSFTFGKLTDIASKMAGALPIIGGIAAGITAVGGAVLEEYINGLKTLSGVSVGFGSTLVELNSMATSAGMSLDGFSKLISENAGAIKSLGTSTQSGAMEFLRLSETLRSGAEQYNQFGLTNTEYNEILMEEIELRRKSGMDSAEIYDSVSNSMNDLLYYTNQLAAITGQNTREMRRSMQAAINDPVVNSIFGRIASQSELAGNNLQLLTGALGKAGTSGIQFSQQIIKSIGTGQDLFVGMNEDLRNAITLSDDLGLGFRDVFEFAAANYASMPSEEFNSRITAMVDAIDTPELRDHMEDLGTAQLSGANTLLEMLNNLSGFNSIVSDNEQVSSETGEALKNSPWMAVPAELENLATQIKESILSGVIDQLGIDTQDAGESFVTTLRELTSNIESNGIVGAATDAVTSSPALMTGTIVTGILAALGLRSAAGAIASPFISGGKFLMNTAITPSAAGASNAARGMMSFARTGGLATTAATAATAGTAAPAASTAAAAAQTGSKFVSFLKWLPLVGDVAQGVSEGLETGSVGRGLFGGVGSFLGRLGLAAAGTATTGVGGVVTQAAGGYAGANIGSGIYDWLFGETTPETATQGSQIPTTPNTSLDTSYLNTIAVQGNTTNVWLRTLTGFTENIRDNISEINTNGNVQNSDELIDLLSNSAQNSEAMLSLMAETNSLLQRLIRRYDETANN